ncbi:MAG: hypothetical protein AAFX50_04535 [Acidobacteriota bacterium]
MSGADGARGRLLRHLLATADDDARLELERAMLDDDELFEELAAAEVELIDAYVGGEIDGEAADRLADLVGRSGRLQETAETTLALGALGGPGVPGARSVPGALGVPGGGGRRSTQGRGLVLLTLVALAAAWLTVSQWLELREARRSLDRLQTTQERLQSDVERLADEVERLEEERLRERRRRAQGAGE